MDVRDWQRAWLGTLITLNVAAAYAWFSTLAIARQSAMGTGPRRTR